MHKLLFTSLIALFLFLGVDCKDEPPVKPLPTNPLQLTVEDVSCTEVWLKLSLSESETNRLLTLKRTTGFPKAGWDSTTASITLTLNGKDTLFLDTLLLPNKPYTYMLVKDKWSASAQLTTMDTTSSDWEWTVEQIGTSSTWLYDVAIVNDSLAFAVGEIDDGDTGTGEKLYNAAKWNGKTWELIKLQHTGAVDPIFSVFAINDSDVWFDPWYHWDGKTFRYFPYDPNVFNVGTTRKMWGNTEELYAVGDNGFIARRSATTGKWQKIASGTTAELKDVWGGSNKWLGENVVLVTSTFTNKFNQNKLLQIKNGVVDSLTLPTAYYTQFGLLISTWFDQNSPVFATGSWVYKFNTFAGWDRMNAPYVGVYRFRGNAANDIIEVGQVPGTGGSAIIHFTGMKWKLFEETIIISGNYKSVAMKKNLTIAVGDQGSFSVGIIAIGKRK